jgi:hypothetical protein
MVGWAIVADLVVEFICMPRYNYTKKKKSPPEKQRFPLPRRARSEGRIPWQGHTLTQGSIQ